MNRHALAAAAAAALALALAGCGGGARGGTATLWVTRDEGAHVLLTAKVDAGLTAMQALAQRAKVKTGYGGRFVDAIGGLATRPQHDWFYYVNGIAVDRSAAEYRLRPGDVEWWDYRAWRNPNEFPVVVGAFPEPFLHGLDGHRPPSVVVGSGAVARGLARVVHGRVAARAPAHAAVLELRRGAGFRALSPTRFVIDPSLAARLVRDPHAFRYRFAVP